MAQDARFTVDTISSQVARLEAPDGSLSNVPAAWLPAEAAEGDVLAVSVIPGDAATVTFRLDPSATAARRRSVRSKLDRLRKRGEK